MTASVLVAPGRFLLHSRNIDLVCIKNTVLLENLPKNATIYVQNKNELEAVGATNNLRGLAANIKFTDRILPQSETTVNKKHSMRDTVEEAKYLISVNKMPISTAQKDALWCCFWSESTLYKNAPWH